MNIPDKLREAAVTRYVMPLREGGSLPALAEADDGFKYVVKFRGGGHGSKPLISELLGGELARYVGLKVPELVFLDLDEDFGRTEGDEEIQDLLKWSRGLNIGLHFLSGAMSWDVAVNRPDSREASMIVWLDAWITNVDRTARNTNMLWWNRELWLIDHGSAFYFHHNWESAEKAALSEFAYVRDHALLPWASELEVVDAEMHKHLDDGKAIDSIVEMLPDEWLMQSEPEVSPDIQRDVYRNFLKTRLKNSSKFVENAVSARKSLV
ncbi:MAG: aminotransferase class I and II [Candidatus Amulumruptor caecigallinarius]|nr:aminotransferase class I and II [Candidatus Amulumruptor caecigallinarius]